MFFDTGSDRKNIRVKNDILRIIAYLFGKDLIGTVADLHFPLFGIGLANFIKGHHDHCCAIGFADKRLFNKFFFSLFHRDGVHNTPALYTFQPRFNDLEFGTIDHDGDAGNIRFALQEVEVSGHGTHAIQHGIVHIHVQDLCAVLHLLTGHR